MNRIIIYIISAFVAISGTFIANKLQLKKVTKPLHRHIEHLQKDSVDFAFYIKKIKVDSTNIAKSDSIKGELIKQMQSTFFDLQKQNRLLKADTTAKGTEIADLKSWQSDALDDGVVTDTVLVEYKTNIFGKRKRIK